MRFLYLLAVLRYAELRLNYRTWRLERLRARVIQAGVVHAPDREVTRWAVASPDGKLRYPAHLDVPGYINTSLGKRFFDALNLLANAQNDVKRARSNLLAWANLREKV